MALRVLLADESSTIKKVFQLALQDFAVDVRPVNVGSDVASVAQSFQPDIIFADVLLQKRNGYEVAAELKQARELQNIPIVLMWSGFMELDEDKFQASHANARLEKPFDVTALRKLVSELVPKTQGQRLSQFLAFPKLPEFDEANPPPVAPPSAPPPIPEEDFHHLPIAKERSPDKHRVHLTAEEMDPQHVPVDVDSIFAGVESDDEDDAFTMHPPRVSTPPPRETAADKTLEIEIEEERPVMAAPPPPSVNMRRPQVNDQAPPPPALAAQAAPVASLTEAQLEAIVRQQSQQTIEALVWKIVPDLATQIIERELSRLLKERESQPY